MLAPSWKAAHRAQTAGMGPSVRVGRLARPAWLIWLISIILTIGAVAILAAILAGPSALASAGEIDAYTVTFLILAPVYASVGALIVSHVSGNRVGWIISGIGLLLAAQDFVGSYATFARTPPGHSLPAGIWMDWLSSWIWIPAVVGALALLPIYFPDGRVPSRRWRPLVWAIWVTAGLALLGVVFSPSAVTAGALGSTNPVGLAVLDPLTDAIHALYVLTVVAGTLAGAASLVIRYRRGSPDERHQVKWFAGAFGLVAVTIAAYAAVPTLLSIKTPDWLIGAILCVGLTVIPVAVGIAVLRYRLYDIDILINRTVLYVSVTAILAAVFAVLSAVSQRAVEALTGERSELVSIALVVVVALGFAPLRRRVQPFVDQLLPGRGLLTLLFTDIVGSTERVVALGDERWRTVLEAYRAAVRRELARFGGQEIDTAGDGFFATFERPTQAVRCAVALRDSLQALGLDSRVGLHMGECELRGERVSGLNVIVAARIMATAKANEIVVSDALRELLAGGDFGFRDRGIELLKGVPGEWRLSMVGEAF